MSGGGGGGGDGEFPTMEPSSLMDSTTFTTEPIALHPSRVPSFGPTLSNTKESKSQANTVSSGLSEQQTAFTAIGVVFGVLVVALVGYLIYKQQAFSNFNLDRNSDIAQKIENWRLSKQGDIAVNKQQDTRITYANMYVTMKSDKVDDTLNPLNGNANVNAISTDVNQKSNFRGIDEVKYDGSSVNTENPLYLIKTPAKTKTKTKRSASPRSPDRI